MIQAHEQCGARGIKRGQLHAALTTSPSCPTRPPERGLLLWRHSALRYWQAMSQEDVEIVRRLLGPFEQGDVVPLFRDDTINASIRAASEPFFT